MLDVAGFSTTSWSLYSTFVKSSIVTGTGERRQGRVYAYDPGNARILAYEKADGKYVNQYRLAEGTDWSDLRGMYVLQGAEEQRESPGRQPLGIMPGNLLRLAAAIFNNLHQVSRAFSGGQASRCRRRTEGPCWCTRQAIT